MKINNQQIDALARKIYQELEATRKEKANELSDKRNALIQAKLSLKVNSGLKEMHEFEDGSYSYHVNNYIQKKYKSEFNKLLIPMSNINQTIIRDQIIIETIECDDLNALINKVKQKFNV